MAASGSLRGPRGVQLRLMHDGSRGPCVKGEGLNVQASSTLHLYFPKLCYAMQITHGCCYLRRQDLSKGKQTAIATGRLGVFDLARPILELFV